MIPIVASKFSERPSGILVPNELRYLSEEERYENIFRQPADKAIPLIRILPHYKVVDLLTRQHLRLNSLASQKDREEGLMTEPARQYYKREMEYYGNAKAISDLPEMENDIRNSVFISCWSKNTLTESIWSEYCSDIAGKPTTDGIAIVTDYTALKRTIPELFQNWFVGEVKYDSRHTGMINYGNAFNQCMVKDLQLFGHENEIRVVRCDTSAEARDAGYIYMPCDLPTLITRLIPHPNASHDYISRLKNFISDTVPEILPRLA